MDALAALGRGSRGFLWAARLLPPERRVAVAELYAFCRGLDDLADELPPDEARAALAPVLAALEEGRPHERLTPLRTLGERFGLDAAAGLLLVRALMADVGPRALTAEAELIRYAYGVAGTVGALICPLLGARDPAALPFAVDLGIAMQLTNVARDVTEDARRGRRYLPLPEGSPCTAARLAVGDPAARAEAWGAIERLLTLADRYYRSADLGIGMLPPRAGLAIRVAARVYEAIGRRTLAAGEAGYWAGQGPRSGGMMDALGGAAEWAFRRSAGVVPHEPALHHALDPSWPGVSTGCDAPQRPSPASRF